MTRSRIWTAALLFVAFSVAGLTGPATAQGPARPTRPPAPKANAGVKVMASEADPNALAVAAAPALAKAAADWKAGRSALAAAESGTGTPAYSADEVAKLLSGTEAAVQKALGEPGLKPLNDRGALVFRRARTALGNPGQGQAEKAAVDRALDPVGVFLDQLAALAGKGAVTTDLCVVSKPDPGARFSIRPASDPAAIKTLPATDGPITAMRGLYVYRLEPVPGSKGKAIQCGWDTAATAARTAAPCLDLFDDAKTPLVCDFAQGACQRAAGSCS